MKRTLSFLLKLAVSAGLLFYLFRHTDFGLLWQSFKGVNFIFFGASVAVFFVFQLVSALRWQKTCQTLGFERAYAFFLRIYFIGIYFNTFLPGLLGGDLVRVFYLVKEGASKAVASLSVLYDRGFGLLAALFLLVLFLPGQGDFLPPPAQRSLFYLTAGGLLLSLALVFGARHLRERFSPELFHTLTAVTLPSNFGKLFCLGLMVQVLFCLHFFLLGESLGLDLPWPRYLLMVPLVGILASLPVSLGGFGVREGSLSYLLALLGYPKELGIALGFLAYGVMLIGGVVGGVLYLGKKAS